MPWSPSAPRGVGGSQAFGKGWEGPEIREKEPQGRRRPGRLQQRKAVSPGVVPGTARLGQAPWAACGKC